jgi:hypothetical protein
MASTRSVRGGKQDAKSGCMSESEIDIEALIEQAVEKATVAVRDEITHLINSKLDKLQKDLQARESKLLELQKENADLKTQLHNQAQSLENVESYARIDNLLIQGIPHSFSGALSQLTPASDRSPAAESSAAEERIFIDFCDQKLGVSVHPSDISICHRLPKSSRATYPPLLVRFTSRKKKLEILRARKQLRNVHLPTPVYINEHLTKHVSTIFAETRKLVKAKKISQTWTVNCHVVLKQLDNTTKTISSLSELAQY